MSVIELKGVTKRWGETVGVDDVSFRVEDGSFAILLGPSGCGKSTTLRMIAGLEDTSAGKLEIGGQDMTEAPPSARNLSMVFQSYALFPHLDVKENIIFGLKVRKISAEERNKRLERVAGIVGLGDVLDRKPAQLSGGQRQRVALARAIIAENPICMMDEPLSNLDAKLRHSMRIEIRALQQRLGMTVIYVTHDQSEAMSMGDKVILMRDGKIEQEGTPETLYDKPATTFAASFIGTPPMKLLDTVAADGAMVFDGEGETPILEKATANKIVGIRPEHITLSDDKGIAAELLHADYLGSETIIDARISGQPILVRASGHIKLPKPIAARLSWRSENVHIFDAISGVRDDLSRAFNV
jgi:sn-glycerol 3-phosphate transport system ATP-binding protein